MTISYLEIKGILAPIILGQGVFWLLLFWLLIARKKIKSNHEKAVYRIGLSGLLLTLSITHPPLLEILSLPLSLHTPKSLMANADAIVVLGGGIDGEGRAGRATMKRTYWGGELLLKGRAPILILTSGATSSSSNKSEASAMRSIAIGMGIPEFKIILEEKSYNTYSNAMETKNLLRKHNIENIILVTSYLHLYRAYKVFKKQGIKVNSIYGKKRIKFSTIGWERADEFQNALYEYGAILLYKFKGWM